MHKNHPENFVGGGFSPFLCRKYLRMRNLVFARFMPTNGLTKPFAGIISFLSMSHVTSLPKRFSEPHQRKFQSIKCQMLHTQKTLFYNVPQCGLTVFQIRPFGIRIPTCNSQGQMNSYSMESPEVSINFDRIFSMNSCEQPDSMWM